MADPGANEPLATTKSLYDILEIQKTATDDDIKKAYRRLALKYHPDKNRDGDPEKTEMFKEINHANAILSSPNKRKVYDEFGDMGLKMMDQVGEDNMKYILNPWTKWIVVAVGIVTGGCCCCCCCCFFCCNFCCGKYKPEQMEEGEPGPGFSRSSSATEPVITQPQPSGGSIVLEVPSRPGDRSTTTTTTPSTETPRPAVIAMPPPSYGATKSV